MLKKVFALLSLVLLLGACGSKNRDNAQMDEQGSLLEQALESGDVESASMLADSLALNVDDLTPGEAVSVLAAFVQVQQQAEKDGKRKKSLETMRKFVDLYDIAFDLDASGMREAISRMRSHYGMPDLEATFVAYRDKLQDAGAASQDEPAVRQDTVSVDSAATAPKSQPEATSTADEDYYD